MADQQSDRDPKRTALAILVGTWRVQIDHPAMPNILEGQATFAWELAEHYLTLRATSPQPEFPDGLALIAPGDEVGTYLQHYFDTRGVTRLYRMGLTDGVWTLRRTEPDFSPLDFCQRFAGRISEDGNRIDAIWEQSFDGGATWELNFPLTYTRVG